MKTQSKYFESSWITDNKWIQYALDRIKTWNALSDRSEILKEMWVLWDREIPIFINIVSWTWINPYLVYKFFWEKWLPVEFFMDKLEKEMDFKASDYWCEWCDFWLETFLKWDIHRIRENFILN